MFRFSVWISFRVAGTILERQLSIRPTLVAGMVALLLTGGAGGCGGDAAGFPPTISGLLMPNTQVAVGVPITLSGTVAFVDPDGDTDRLGYALVPPGGGAATEGPVGAISGSVGMTAGTIPFAILIQLPTAGAWTLRVWALDKAGHRSNTLEKTLTAE